MRKLLGKNTAPAEQKPQPLKAGAGASKNPPAQDQPVARGTETLAERLQRQGPTGEAAAIAEQAATQPYGPPQYSVVGQSMVIEGVLEAAEDLTIAGRLEGSVRHTANQLTVAATGVVKADIQAQNLVVEGQVEGDINSRESVTLNPTAEVRGNIQTARLTIENGAQFNGKVIMVEAP